MRKFIPYSTHKSIREETDNGARPREETVIDGGENFIFFESGFEKLSLREVELYLGERKSRNRTKVVCASGSDYAPCCRAYGYSFESIACTKMNRNYLWSDEYKRRQTGFENSLAEMYIQSLRGN